MTGASGCDAGRDFVVLGVDPGSRRMGYGLVAEAGGTLRLVAAGVIRPPLDGSWSDRLGAIFFRLREVIETYAPHEAAVEDVFVRANPASALKLGQARGAALTACASVGLPVFSYEAPVIKKCLVGGGRADKEQVAFMVARLLGCREKLALDASDAVAAAVCHLNQRRLSRLARLTAPARG